MYNGNRVSNLNHIRNCYYINDDKCFYNLK